MSILTQSLTTFGGSLRFDVADKTQVLDLLSSAETFYDKQYPMPNIPWNKRGEIKGFIIKKLNPQNDMLYLNLYIMEFRGHRNQSLNDPSYFSKEMLNTLQNCGGPWDVRILAYFHWLWISDGKSYKLKLEAMRKAANDFYREEFLILSQDMEKKRGFSQIIPNFRKDRLQILMSVYGDDFADYIWRILSIDDIGTFLDDYVETYKKHEEMVQRTSDTLILDSPTLTAKMVWEAVHDI